MSVAELLKSRISVRAFLDKPLDETTIRAVLDAARFAPSGSNMQPWKVIAVAGEEKDRLSALAQTALIENPEGEEGEFPIHLKGVGEPYRSRRFKVGEDMYAALGIPREDRMARLMWLTNNYRFFNAPVGLFFVIDRSMGHAYWAHLGMFMQSVALAAQDIGLGSCMQEAWARVRKTLHAHFALPENEVIYCGMAIGYADMRNAVNNWRSERAPVDEFASFRGF